MSRGPRLSRRALLGGAGAVAGLAVTGVAGAWLSRPAQPGLLLPSRAPLPPRFGRALPIPAVLTPGRHPDHPDADYYEITAQAAGQEIVPGLRTPIWGYNGTFPGPTIVSTSGRRTVVRHINRLPVPTVAHLHGGHTPAASDGYPTDLVLPVGMSPAALHMPGMDNVEGDALDPAATISVGSRDFEYPMRQRAAALWYHDHRMGFTGQSVWRGLAGIHLVRDAEEAALPLPGGDREIPLMITDRSFDADGSLRYPALDPIGMQPGVTAKYMGGVLGDVILVNGTPWPVLNVARCRYRLRLLNASNARRYGLLLDPAPRGVTRPLVQIGSDGGLLDAPVTHDSIEIAPAERFDVIVDFADWPAGQEVTLRNTLDSGPAGLIMRFRVGGDRPDDTRVPDRLAVVERLDPARAAVRRDIVFRRDENRWSIAGALFDPARPQFTSRLGDIEVWNIVTDAHHPVHVHLTHFQIVARRGTLPGPYDSGWKDTVDLAPAEAVTLVLRFDDYAGRFLMHCHNLEHEDMAMMARIDTTTR
ncbi:MAG TPA: multicopper oxidase domain-containing protein [Actinoplanes sp.]|nr:multicopper oxidase domain-containing protein [Actinoplanes sp.]